MVAPQTNSEPVTADLNWLKSIAARYTLGEMRPRSVTRLLDGHSGDVLSPALEQVDSRLG